MTDKLSENQGVTVPAALSGERLDKVAAALFPSYSRAELSRWIRLGELTVDGAVVKPKAKVRGGEVLMLAVDPEPRDYWEAPEAIDLSIVHADEDLIVIDKPPGLVVHPGAGNLSGTLVNGLLYRFPELSTLPRAGIVHRLDKDTSGLMIVARSSAAHRKLVDMIANREVHRQYVGVTEGRMISGRDVDAPIGRDPHVRTRQAVREDGKPAFTEFRVLARYRAHSLVRARLGSGRTHQIRVHLQSIGYPLVGDRRYGARGKLPASASAQVRTGVQSFARQALHAERLMLLHPASGAEVEFKATLPGDMRALIELLETDARASGH